MQISRSTFTNSLSAILIAVIVSACSSETNKQILLERAQRDVEAGQYDNARIEYLNVLQADPHNGIAIQQLGTIWFEDGAPIKALPFLLKAKELALKELGGRVKLATAMMTLGDVSNARKEALSILATDPTNDDSIVLLADTARTPKEVDETAQRLQKFRWSDKPSFYLASAVLSIRKGDLTTAEDAIQHALALDAKSPSAHLAKADVLLLKGDSVRAAEEVKTAAGLAPVRSNARLKYAEFEANAGDLARNTDMLKEITRQAPDYLPAWGALAKIAYREKRYDDSLALLENIFNRDPSNLEGRLLQYDVLLAKGEVKSALDGLDRLNSLYPHIPVIKYDLARAYLRNDNPPGAISELNQVLALNPDFVDAILLLGEANLRAGDAQPVTVSMQQLLNKHPNLIQARVLLADAYSSLGKFDDAARTFRDQISVSPQSPRPYVGLGLILRQQGKTSEARKAFERAQELEPQNPTPVEQLVELDILGKDFSSAFQRVRGRFEGRAQPSVMDFLEAKVYFAQGDWDRAEVALLKALQGDPNYSKAYDLLIYTYIAANKLPDASSRVNSLLSKQPNDLRLLMLSGLIYDKMNQFTKARDAYEKLLSLRPYFEAALNNLAWLYAEKLNDLDKAYDLARKARALEPGAAPIADTLGWILYKRADYAQALDLLRESAAKLGNSPEAQLHLGMALYMMGQMDAARTALRHAVDASSQFPGKQDALSRLALLGNGSGDPVTPPIEELRSILKQQPDDVVARLLLGDAYQGLGKFADAAEAYEEAVKINRQLLPAFTRLQKLYAGPLGNTEKAAEFASKVKALSPDSPRAASSSAVGKL
jgi:tetratricopeptide (TPR) repeat protein